MKENKVKLIIGKDDNGNIIENIRYDETGNSIHEYYGGVPDEEIVVRDMIYDSHSNIVLKDIKVGGITTEHETTKYEYNSVGHIIKKIVNANGSIGIRIVNYDKNDKICSIRINDKPLFFLYYDERGNLIHILSGRIDRYQEFDENNNMLHKLDTIISSNGNISIMDEIKQKFDKNNNIISYEDNEIIAEYKYDSNNNLIWEKCSGKSDDEKDNEIKYSYNKDDLLIRKEEINRIVNYEYEFYE
jgi:hypothetical protein